MAESRALLLVGQEGDEGAVEDGGGTAAPLPLKERMDASTIRLLLKDMVGASTSS